MAINDHSDFFIYVPNDVETLTDIVTTGCEERSLQPEEGSFPFPQKEWVKILLTSHLVVYAHLWDKQMLEETPS